MELISKKIVAAYLLFLVFGVKGQKKTVIYPKESFSVIKGELSDGKPFIGSVNMGYRDYEGKGNYPWCLEINIALNPNGIYENGLPRQSEINVINKFEDELLEHIKERATMHYIAHMYNDGFLDIYIYLDKPEQANAYLKQAVNKDGIIRPFTYKISKDGKWETIRRLFK